MNPKSFVWISFFSLCLAFSFELFSIPAKGIIHIENKGQLDKYLAMRKPVVLIFSADWCSACKASAPTIEWAIAEYPEVLFLIVMDERGNVEIENLKKQYRTGAFPTFILIKADGTKVYQDAHSVSSHGFMEDLLKKITTVKPSEAPAAAPKQAPMAQPKPVAPEKCTNPTIEHIPQAPAMQKQPKKAQQRSKAMPRGKKQVQYTSSL